MTNKKTAQLELTGGIPTGEAHGTRIVPSSEVIEVPKAPAAQESLTPQHICNLLESMAINHLWQSILSVTRRS
jgi:hypothetical protein